MCSRILKDNPTGAVEGAGGAWPCLCHSSLRCIPTSVGKLELLKLGWFQNLLGRNRESQGVDLLLRLAKFLQMRE